MKDGLPQPERDGGGGGGAGELLSEQTAPFSIMNYARTKSALDSRLVWLHFVPVIKRNSIGQTEVVTADVLLFFAGRENR